MSNVPPVLPGVGAPIYPSIQSFDGETSIDLGLQPELNNLTSDFTVAAWIKLDTVVGKRRIIASQRPGGFGFAVNNARLLFTTLGIKGYFGTRDVLETNVWIHVTAVMNDDFDVLFYVNGQHMETISGTGPGKPSTDVTYLGSLDDRIEFFAGEMRDVRAYDAALTPDQVVMLARV